MVELGLNPDTLTRPVVSTGESRQYFGSSVFEFGSQTGGLQNPLNVASKILPKSVWAVIRSVVSSSQAIVNAARYSASSSSSSFSSSDDTSDSKSSADSDKSGRPRAKAFRIRRVKATDALDASTRAQLLNTHPNGTRLVEAIDILAKLAVERNHTASATLIADMHMYGEFGVPANIHTARRWYSYLGDVLGDAHGQYMLGLIHVTGLGGITNLHGAATERDNARGLMYLTFAAAQNHTESQMTLANRYMSGLSVPQSCSSALPLYRAVAQKAVEHYRNGPPAGRALPRAHAVLFTDGTGLYGIDYTEVSQVGWMRIAKDQFELEDMMDYWQHTAKQRQDITAMFNLASYCYHGASQMEPNYGLALNYLHKIVSIVYPPGSESTVKGEKPKQPEKLTANELLYGAEAAGMLGLMYWRGEGVPRNEKTATYWFKKGAESMHWVSLNAIGIMYRDGSSTIKQDPEKAMQYFLTAAEMDYASAQANYANMLLHYKRPTGFENNYNQRVDVAAQNYNLAARTAQVEALFGLGNLYERGKIISQSCTMAVQMYRKIAERGDWLHSPMPAAHAAIHTDNDNWAALIHYIRASEMGYDAGLANAAYLIEQKPLRKHIIERALPGRMASELAGSYWVRAAALNFPDARVRVGDYYYYGLIAPPSTPEVRLSLAAEAYRAAAESEYSPVAMWNLGWMYENGLGVPKDYVLAKRWYDKALDANPDSTLAVRLSLIKLFFKYHW
ncbi:HCP-like protein, partial [Ramicandelaber brevisporus]